MNRQGHREKLRVTEGAGDEELGIRNEELGMRNQAPVFVRIQKLEPEN
jgi:hypothetical protein